MPALRPASRFLTIALVLLLGSFRTDGILAQAVAVAASPQPVSGRLETVDGMRVLTLWGDPEARGRATGQLMHDAFFEILEGYVLSLEFTGGALWDKVVRPRILERFVFDEDHRAWARGLLEGLRSAGEGAIRSRKLGRDLEVEDVLATSCVPDLAGLLCSSFVAWGDAADAGGVLMGRNLDYVGTKGLASNTIMVVEMAREGHLGWVGVGYPGLYGCLTGVNEKGVSIAIHDVFERAAKGARGFTTRVVALKEIIETAEPAEDLPAQAAARLGRHRFALGGNAMLGYCGEKARGAAVLEFDDRDLPGLGRCCVRSAEPGRESIVCTNHHRRRGSDGFFKCERFAAVTGALEHAARPLDLAGAWRTIETGSVRITLYRVVADLSRGIVEVDHRPGPLADFGPRSRFEVAALLGARHEVAPSPR